MVELKLVHKLLLFIAVVLSMVTLSRLFTGGVKEDEKKVEHKVEINVEPKPEKKFESIPMPSVSQPKTVPEDIWSCFGKASDSPSPRKAPMTRLDSTQYGDPAYRKMESIPISVAPVSTYRSDEMRHVLIGNDKSPQSIAFSIPDASMSSDTGHDRLLM
jgi:hypothetical protein